VVLQISCRNILRTKQAGQRGQSSRAGQQDDAAAERAGNLNYLTLLSAISRAEQSVHLTVAYLAPDPQLRKVLTDAAPAWCGGDARLPSYSDSGAIFHLGRSYYTDLLRAGVVIHERCGAVMHDLINGLQQSGAPYLDPWHRRPRHPAILVVARLVRGHSQLANPHHACRGHASELE
jgi:phosphatidylserine/phosphatidylglycerophosphate/cardiolipin synthase-like enzyme